MKTKEMCLADLAGCDVSVVEGWKEMGGYVPIDKVLEAMDVYAEQFDKSEKLMWLRDILLMKMEAIDGFISMGLLSDEEPLREEIEFTIQQLSEIIQ